MSTTWPMDLELRVNAPELYGSDGADRVTMFEAARKSGTINSVQFIPNWTLSGANTNSRTFTLYNRGPAGAGTVAVATLALASGVNLTKFVAKTIPVTAGNGAILVGDILEWESLHVGTGIPDPGGRVVVQFALTS